MGAPTADAPIISRSKKRETKRKMKKLTGFLFAAMAVALLSVSCRKVVRDDVRALVEEINDTVMYAQIDGKKVKFDIKESRFGNGAVMYGDSVIITYIGDLDEKRAFAESVYLLERKSPVITIDKNKEPDPSAEVKTRPADPEQDAASLKNSQRMIKAAKKYVK